MGSNFAPNPGLSLDQGARPGWWRTGHKHFPFAAQQSGQWWVLRMNFGFPEHDMFTLFVDGQAAADITADPGHPVPLLASVGALQWAVATSAVPILDEATAAAVVASVSGYADYGSEHGDPCLFCAGQG